MKTYFAVLDRSRCSACLAIVFVIEYFVSIIHRTDMDNIFNYDTLCGMTLTVDT